MECGTITLIRRPRENPSFQVNAALLSCWSSCLGLPVEAVVTILMRTSAPWGSGAGLQPPARPSEPRRQQQLRVSAPAPRGSLAGLEGRTERECPSRMDQACDAGLQRAALSLQMERPPTPGLSSSTLTVTAWPLAFVLGCLPRR